MEKYVLKNIFLICLFIIIVVSSCGFKEPLFEVLDGNYKFIQGDYTGATISYIKALENKSYDEWIYYNLGNVYNALGETDAAIEELLRATKDQHPEVLFRAHFNLGNIYYGLGKYKKAIDNYKQALKAKQGEIDAKINLELAVEKMEKEMSLEQNQQTVITNDVAIENTEVNDLLEYIKEREAFVWKSLNQPENPEEIEDDW